jgi:hypothetical protein
MKETILACLVISIISIGGLGLYVYNNKHDTSSDEDNKKYNKNYNETFFYNEPDEDHNDEVLEDKFKIKKQNKANTKRNKKNDGTKKIY